MSLIPSSSKVLLLCGLFFFHTVYFTNAAIITVFPHEDECYYEQIEQSNKLMGSFEVISGGLLDIDVTVYGPANEVHYTVQRQKTGTFSLLAPITGAYRICLSNRMSTLTEKTVAFSIHVGDELFRDIAKQEHVTPLENEITELADGVAKIEDEQQYMWARERAARDTNESTNSRVMWYSVLEAVVMFSLGFWQIMYLKSGFEKKGKY